jgi:CheY-like chemotaxis protein
MARSGFFSVDSLKGVHVLVVDDEALARDVIKEILEYCGALVLTVASSGAAVHTMQLIRPDVIVTKLALPDGDGLSLVGQLRALARPGSAKIPAVAVTAAVGDRERCLAHGFQAHFTWPLDPWEFTRAISGLTMG